MLMWSRMRAQAEEKGTDRRDWRICSSPEVRMRKLGRQNTTGEIGRRMRSLVELETFGSFSKWNLLCARYADVSGVQKRNGTNEADWAVHHRKPEESLESTLPLVRRGRWGHRAIGRESKGRDWAWNTTEWRRCKENQCCGNQEGGARGLQKGGHTGRKGRSVHWVQGSPRQLGREIPTVAGAESRLGLMEV